MEEHVMISYNQKSSGQLASKLHDKLKEENYKTWIDYQEISGSIKKAMASAVDGAFLVLVLLTDEYCQSQNCQDECEYASHRNKPIIPIRVNKSCNPIETTGLVGFVVSRLLYVDFSDESKFDNSFNTLLELIRKYDKNRNLETETHGSRIEENVKKYENSEATDNKKLTQTEELIELCKSRSNKFEEIKKLIEKNADVNVKCRTDGSTALIRASENGHIETAKLLLDNGADVNAKSLDGSTALIAASCNGHVGMIKCLIEHRANVNEKNSRGSTALMKASYHGHIDTVRYLLSVGANINERSNNGSTALSKAKQGGKRNTVKLLIENGARM